jgi:DNA-binding transcriptional regulator YiaG
LSTTRSPKSVSKTPNATKPKALPFYARMPPVSIGQKISHFRLKSRKTRKHFASELGVSVKTLWGWETDRWLPSELLKKRIGEGLFL